MIVKEFYKTRKDGVNLYRTHSDAGYYIKKVGTEQIYSSAVDVENAPYEYVETDKPIKEEEKETQITSEEFDTMIEEVL